MGTCFGAVWGITFDVLSKEAVNCLPVVNGKSD